MLRVNLKQTKRASRSHLNNFESRSSYLEFIYSNYLTWWSSLTREKEDVWRDKNPSKWTSIEARRDNSNCRIFRSLLGALALATPYPFIVMQVQGCRMTQTIFKIIVSSSSFISCQLKDIKTRRPPYFTFLFLMGAQVFPKIYHYEITFLLHERGDGVEIPRRFDQLVKPQDSNVDERLEKDQWNQIRRSFIFDSCNMINMNRLHNNSC